MDDIIHKGAFSTHNLTPDDMEPSAKNLYYKDVKVIFHTDDIESINNSFIDSRWQYYRLRGKPVTEEQAAYIIGHTQFEMATWQHENEAGANDVDNEVAFMHDFINNWFGEQDIESPHNGWCHPDGTIGANNHMDRLADLDGALWELAIDADCFPYLDMVIIVTKITTSPYDQGNPDYWDLSAAEYVALDNSITDEKLAESVIVGFWVHNKTIEVFSPTEAFEKYKEYHSLYGNPPEKFSPHYYLTPDSPPIPSDYMEQCINSFTTEAGRAFLRRIFQK